MFFSRKKREEAQRKAVQEAQARAAREAQERAAREAAERKAQEEAARKAKEAAEDAPLIAAKEIYKRADSAYFSGELGDAIGLYVEAFEKGYFPAGERLMQYYKNVAAGKVRELPFYNSSAVDYCYKMAYNWARNALRAAFLQSRKGRGREYEKNMFFQDTESFMQDMRAELAEMDLYRQGFGAGPESAFQYLALAGEAGDRIKFEVEQARNAEYFIDLEKKGLWTLDGPVPEDLPEGITDFGRYYAALSYRDGTWSEVDPVKAFKLFQAVSNDGYYAGSLALARCYEDGIGTQPDPEAALRYYAAASAFQNYEIWAYCARAFVKAGLYEDWVRSAVDQMTRRRYAPAMIAHAMMLEAGFGADKDPKAALEALTDASLLYQLYESDQGGHTTYIADVMELLTKHFRTALREGTDPESLYYSADHKILDFKGFPVTEEKVAILNALLDTPYKENAENTLYTLYTYAGKGDPSEELHSASENANYLVFYKTTKVPEEAFRLGLQFAEKGDATAMYQTGIRYCRGIGTERDPERAEYWLNKALENGCPGAEAALAHMDDPEDILKSNAVITDHKGNHLERAKALHLGRDICFDEGLALKELDLAAEEGEVEALELLMNFYLSGPAYFRDQWTAIKYAKRAGAAGSAKGYRLCGEICEKESISNSKYAFEYYQMAEKLGDTEAGERAHKLIEDQKQNYELGLQAVSQGYYMYAYHLWYPYFLAKDDRIVLPAAEAFSKVSISDPDDVLFWIFSRAYEMGETRYAGDAARACWFSNGSYDNDRVIDWFLKDPSLTPDELYILAKAYQRDDYMKDYVECLDNAFAGGCYMASYELAIYYISQGDRPSYIWGETIAKTLADNPNRYDPAGFYSQDRIPTPEQLFSRLRELDRGLTEAEEKEAYKRAVEFKERQYQAAQRRAAAANERAAANASNPSLSSPLGNPFENYGLTDDKGNTYDYDPATGRLRGRNVDGHIDLSPDAMRRRKAEHEMNEAVEDFLKKH